MQSNNQNLKGIVEPITEASAAVNNADLYQNYQKNNGYYSKKFQELMLSLQPPSAGSSQGKDSLSLAKSAFWQKYREKYRIAPWPFIISKDIVQQFNDCIKPLTDICYEAILTFFGDDSQKFTAYLDDSPVIYELLKTTKFNSKNVLLRHDAVFTNGELKLVEINAGSTIGGWQHDWMSEVYDESLAANNKTASWNLKFNNVTKNLFDSICKSIKQNNPNASGNVLFYEYDDDAYDLEDLKQNMRDLYHKAGHFSHGEVLFFNDPTRLEFKQDGSVQYQGKTIDAVLLSAPLPFPVSFYTRLMTCYMRGKLVFPDNLFHTLLGNKLLFALLHEASVLEQVDGNTRSFIERHIPWTAKTTASAVFWKGQRVALEELLLSQKELFVLKKARSAQGADVYLGRDMETEHWCKLVSELQQTAGWIAQEYCVPDTVVACNENAEPGAYQPVWGIFDTGNQYGGAFVRAKLMGHGNGVINSANGALEFLVYEEVSNYKNRLVV
jgi:hypothetical protein